MNDDQWLVKLTGAVPEGAPVAAPPVSQPQAEAAPFAAEPAPVAPSHMLPQTRAEIVAVVEANDIATKSFPPEPSATRKRKVIHDEMPSLGLLDQFMNDQNVGDILVNGINSIYIDAGGQLRDSGVRFSSHEEVWEIAERIVKSVGQHLSHERPMVDTRLPDGSRVNIVAPPMAVDGVTISIRKFPARQVTLETMVESGQLTPELAKFLKLSTAGRMNIIIAGGTGSGKTTLLNALSGAISPDERVVTIEDSAELRLQQPHVVRLEAKVATTQDKAHHAVSIRDLVKNALRMRPDRIIVGESRGAEALDVLQAMNTGHDGSMTTLHANGPRDALGRLETMVSVAMPQLPMRLVRQQIASTVNLIIHMARCKDGVRRIMHVSEVAGMEGEIIIMQDLVVYTEATTDRIGQFRWSNGAPRNQTLTDAARASGLLRGAK